ncbi:carbohydrate-binding module family 13 [Trichoderma arundinaceum]|uniref:Carbohydrate-binding module family 13 n=1 Tax=Trichoderma arundinaceum TaxID=490622 RepID=A0A395NJL5_TRIAR|nr:carbohydrate-binding module family 13 [Trichoderma arundinaceum]
MSLAEGTYYIRSALSQRKSIDLEASQPLGRIIEYQFHRGNNQQWNVVRISNDEYGIQSVATGTNITAPNGNDATAYATRLNPDCNNVARWKIVRASPNGNNWVIRSVAFPNKVLDVTGSNQADVTPIIVYPYHGGANQQFTFTRSAMAKIQNEHLRSYSATGGLHYRDKPAIEVMRKS